MGWPLTFLYEFSIVPNMLNETPIDVKAIRTNLRMSQKQFGALLGVDQSVISDWERKGVPRRGTSRKVLENLMAFGVAAFRRGSV